MCALGLLDWSGVPLGPVSHIASSVRVFLTLIRAVAAVQIFYTPARKIWKTTVVTRSRTTAPLCAATASAPYEKQS